MKTKLVVRTQNAVNKSNIIDYWKNEFIGSFYNFLSLPPDNGREIVIAGKSNVGKSSTINLIARTNLARTSKLPGCTKSLNYFRLYEYPGSYIVDLPGYGFSRVNNQLRINWKHLVEEYLLKRNAICGIILVLDIRRMITTLDIQLLTFLKFIKRDLMLHILLNKTDKICRNEINTKLQQLRKELSIKFPEASSQLFSALTGYGLEELHTILKLFFNRRNII